MVEVFASIVTVLKRSLGLAPMETARENYVKIFGGTPEEAHAKAIRWAEETLNDVQVGDIAARPVRAVKELRVRQPRLSLLGGKTLVDELIAGRHG